MYLEDLKKRKTFPLHIHWDGSIPAEHLFKLAESRGKEKELLLPDKDAKGNAIHYSSSDERLIKDAEHLESVMHALRQYDLVQVFSYATRFMQTKEDILATAAAHCEYLKRQNVPYAETRFAPQYHIFGGLSVEQVIDCAVEGFQIGKEMTGVDARLILSIGREADPDEGVKIAEAAVAYNERYPEHVLGIDLACEERGDPPEKHYPAFRKTFDTPLKRTVHAGEMCDEETNVRNIKTAIYKLKADGLGHAIPLHKNPALIEEVLKRKIRVESNPISNQFFFNRNIHEDIRLDKLVEQGVLVTVNPDDPAMIPNGHLADNFQLLAELYGMGFVDTVIKNSIIAAWGLSEEKKDSILNGN